MFYDQEHKPEREEDLEIGKEGMVEEENISYSRLESEVEKSIKEMKNGEFIKT